MVALDPAREIVPGCRHHRILSSEILDQAFVRRLREEKNCQLKSLHRLSAIHQKFNTPYIGT
jgi:hypothetical protein